MRNENKAATCMISVHKFDIAVRRSIHYMRRPYRTIRHVATQFVGHKASGHLKPVLLCKVLMDRDRLFLVCEPPL